MIVYRITHVADSKVYIGKWMGSARVEDRWQEHRRDARNGSRLHFHNAIRKYGPDAFKLEILYTANSVEELNAMETFFIVLHQSFKPENGYNLTMGGDGGAVGPLNHWFGTHGPMGGKHHTEKSKRKISLALKGVSKTSKHNEAVAEAQTNRWAAYSLLERKEIGQSISKGRRGIPNPNRGKSKLSTVQIESARKMRESGASYSQIGSVLGVGAMTIWRRARHGY